MSTRRELTKTQAALNELVRQWLVERGRVVPMVGRIRTLEAEIEAAYAEWDRIRANLEGKGVTGTRETSIEASLPDKGSERRTVLDHLCAHHAHFHAGMTCDQIEAALRRPHQSISARVHELEQRGLIQDSGHKALTRSSRKAIVYVPTDRARQLYRDAHAGEVG